MVDPTVEAHDQASRDQLTRLRWQHLQQVYVPHSNDCFFQALIEVAGQTIVDQLRSAGHGYLNTLHGGTRIRIWLTRPEPYLDVFMIRLYLRQAFNQEFATDANGFRTTFGRDPDLRPDLAQTLGRVGSWNSRLGELAPALAVRYLGLSLIVIRETGELSRLAPNADAPTAFIMHRRQHFMAATPINPNDYGLIQAQPLRGHSQPQRTSEFGVPIDAGRYLPGPDDGPEHQSAARALPRFEGWLSLAAHFQPNGRSQQSGIQLNNALLSPEDLAARLPDLPGWDVNVTGLVLVAAGAATDTADEAYAARLGRAFRDNNRPIAILAADGDVWQLPDGRVQTGTFVQQDDGALMPVTTASRSGLFPSTGAASPAWMYYPADGGPPREVGVDLAQVMTGLGAATVPVPPAAATPGVASPSRAVRWAASRGLERGELTDGP